MITKSRGPCYEQWFRHDSSAVEACAQFHSNYCTTVWMTAKWNSVEIEIRYKNRSWNGPRVPFIHRTGIVKVMFISSLANIIGKAHHYNNRIIVTFYSNKRRNTFGIQSIIKLFETTSEQICESLVTTFCVGYSLLAFPMRNTRLLLYYDARPLYYI